MKFPNRDKGPSEDRTEALPPPPEGYFRVGNSAAPSRALSLSMLQSTGVAALLVGGLIVLLVGVAAGVLLVRNGEPPIATGPLYDEPAVISLFEAAAPSVVELIVHWADGSTDTGAGFFIDSDGHVVTNSHVVDGATSVDVSLADGRILEGRLLGSSPSDDLALIAVDADQVTDIKPLKLADSSALKVGQFAIAIGSPFRMQNFLSVGVVAGIGDSPALLRDRRTAPALQRPIPNMVWADVALLPGNSGGPLLNSNGEVIGVTSAVQISAQGDFGIGFAVPSNILAGLMPRLLESELVSRPWLGIRGTSVTPDISAALGISAESGVYIREVIPNTGAAAARLRDDPFQAASGRGDVIVAVDGHRVASVSEMVDYFNTLLPGDDVVLTVLRDGVERTIGVTLGGWPAPGG